MCGVGALHTPYHNSYLGNYLGVGVLHTPWPAIIATWALIREWALTTVLLFKYQLCLLTIDVATYECGCSNLFALDLCAI